jgi:hypothetical protein
LVKSVNYFGCEDKAMGFLWKGQKNGNACPMFRRA